MQELLDALRQAGYEPGAVALDGKMRRFGRNGGKDNAWLIGWQNHSAKTGQVYAVAVYGDWRTGEELTYKPSGGTSREDMAVIKAQIDSARRAREDDRKERAAAASLKADKIWKSSAEVFESAYYERKLIAAPYGTRTFASDSGRAIVVPMRDVDGGLWGCQRIFADGTKRFLTGQRVDGCFHLIGETFGAHLLVCEGFATGASLREATGLSVAVAFNAGNLVAVAKAIRIANPNLAITIAGDDDRWSDPNAGRDKAGKAGMLAQAAVVFPTFADVEGRPTDFNDMHAREGLEAVTRHFAQPKAREVGFIPLGHDEGTHYFYSVQARDVVKVTNFATSQLFMLAPADYWSEMFPSKTGTDWEGVKNDLVQTSLKLGPFNTGRIRGTGVWLDDGRVAVNTGHSLIVNSQPMPLQSVRSWYVYVQTKKRMPPLRTDPLTVAECGRLVAACAALKWRAKDSRYFLAGWLAIARIAGALPIRPHVWLTGSSATGKSTVLDKIVAPCLGGPAGRLYVQGGSTEAGIRQEVKSSSVPVVFDEFETTGQATAERVASIVELLRQSWSQTQGVVLKGSATGAAVHYQLSFAALVSSIRVGLQNDADRSRFAVLELAPHGSDPDEWRSLETLLRGLTDEYGERLFARSCANLGAILDSQATIAEALVRRGSTGQRLAQQYGTLLAGYWSLQSDEPITPEQANAIAAEVDLSEQKADAALTDELECLNHLLTSRIAMRDGDKSIGRIASEGTEGERASLKNYGVIVDPRGIMVANCHAELAKLFASTRWRDNWRASLLRIPGAKLEDRAYYGASRSRSVLIPYASVPSCQSDPSKSLP